MIVVEKQQSTRAGMLGNGGWFVGNHLPALQIVPVASQIRTERAVAFWAA